MRALLIVLGFVWGSAVLEPVAAEAAAPACLSADAEGLADRDQLAAVATQIEAQCPCASFDGSKRKTHFNYLLCVKDVIRTAMRTDELRTPCRRVAMYAAGKAICGYRPEQERRPCLRRLSGGGLTCAIKPEKFCRGAASQRCEVRTSCVEAADSNGDLQVSSTDSGACKPLDCAGDRAQWQSRIDNWVVECFDGCTDPLSFQECVIGCASGADEDVLGTAMVAHLAICNANPLVTCEDFHTSVLQWCADNPNFAIACDQHCFGDPTCTVSCHLVANCERAASAAYQYCLQTF